MVNANGVLKATCSVFLRHQVIQPALFVLPCVVLDVLELHIDCITKSAACFHAEKSMVFLIVKVFLARI